MTVRLGALIDPTTKVQEAALRQWQGTFARMYGDLMYSIPMLLHHQKRVRTITRRLNDATLMEQYPEGSEGRTQAQDALDRHTARMGEHAAYIAAMNENVSGFWKARPDGADRWFRDEFFAYCNVEPDPVIEYMVAQYGGVWVEIRHHWERSSDPPNRSPCPY